MDINSKVPEEVIEKYILSHKNPTDIIKVCKDNQKWLDACLDQDSFLWDNFIIKYYYSLQKFRHPDISLKDFYVLLYYAEILGIHQYTPIITRTQLVLNILPKIYDGDHLTILNACCNPAITSNQTNLVMFRSKTDHNTPYCGAGYLRVQFHPIQKDIFLTDNSYTNLPRANGVDIYHGGYRPNI